MNSVMVNSNGRVTNVYIGGMPLKNIQRITFEQEVDMAPVFEFEVVGLPSISVDNADIRFEFTPRTVVEAVSVLREQLMKDAELYDAFHASILSAILEMPDDFSGCELATRILDRIIGERE